MQFVPYEIIHLLIRWKNTGLSTSEFAVKEFYLEDKNQGKENLEIHTKQNFNKWISKGAYLPYEILANHLEKLIVEEI
jgi:hypothetical protein